MNTTAHRLCDFIYDPQMNGQTLAVLAMLSSVELNSDFGDYVGGHYNCYTEVSRFCNCIEQGFILHFTNNYYGGNKSIYFAVAEYRSSDCIIVYYWEEDNNWGNRPKSIHDFTEKQWKSSRLFEYLDIKGCVRFILGSIKTFVKNNKVL